MGRAYEVRKAAMAKTSAANAKLYSRFSKEIYITAKKGEPNPDLNVELSRVIDKARANDVPKDVIDRAIEKAKGGADEHYDPIRYEGFGPGSSTVIVDCLTDNTNRTFSEVRNCFTKTDSKIGVNGSVSHMYDRVGLIAFDFDDEEAVLETLIMDDVDVHEIESNDGEINVIVGANDLYNAKEHIDALLESDDVDYHSLEITMIPHDHVELDDESKERFNKLMDMLDECEDVQNVYHNVIM